MAKHPKKMNSDAMPEAVALHGKSPDGKNHIVGLWNIRVLICPDGPAWFAQGIDIDYAAQGNTLDDVKLRFQEGLRATIEQNLKTYDTIERLLAFAPPSVLLQMIRSKSAFKALSQVSFHEIGPAVQQAMNQAYEGIQYFIPAEAA
jgi:hypothetical protein